MWNWFAPKCPVKLRDKVWVEQRTRWLIREFGRRPLLESNTILPTPEFFPDPFSGVEDDVLPMLRRVCQYMECDPDRFRLSFFDGDKPSYDEEGNPLWGAAGYYVLQDGVKRPMIRVSTTILRDPLALVATLAHEVAHDRLLGELRVSVEEPDHEPLADLTTVFFGLGIFPAVTAFRTAAWKDGMMQRWEMSTQGYLPDNVFGYALALRSWLREESAMPWSRHLTINPRAAYRDGLRYLHKTNDCITSRQEMLDGTLSKEVALDDLRSSTDGIRLAAIQRLSEVRSPSDQQIAALVECLRHSNSTIQAETINRLFTEESLPADAVSQLLTLMRISHSSVPIQAAMLLGAKCDTTDGSPVANRLLNELLDLSVKVDSEHLGFLIEPLAKFGARAEPAVRLFLDELHLLLTAGQNQAAVSLLGYLLRMDPNLDARVRRLWPEIANIYEVAAREARQTLGRGR